MILKHRTASRLWLLLFLFAALLLVAAACDGDEGNQTTPSPEATSETPTEETPGEGTPTEQLSPVASFPSGRLPDDFPEDFPLYPDAVVSQSLRPGNQIFVTFESDDPRDEVAAFFRAELEKPPWKVRVQQDNPTQNSVIISFEHLEEDISGFVNILSISTDGGSTVISLQIFVPPSGELETPSSSPTSTPAQQGGSSWRGGSRAQGP